MSIPPSFEPGDALLLVDPQIDFCPDGALPVADGDRVMPVLNVWSAAAEGAGVPIFVSRDWHPARTDFQLPAQATVVSKGMGEHEDAYSAFQARDESGALLAALLAQKHVNHLYIGGLATDYCVKSSTLDALADGFRVTLVPDGMRAVNLQPTDGDAALEEMRAAGADEYES